MIVQTLQPDLDMRCGRALVEVLKWGTTRVSISMQVTEQVPESKESRVTGSLESKPPVHQNIAKTRNMLKHNVKT